MSLLDLRPYWLFNKKACGAEQPEPGRQMGWLCTLPTGHDGKHVAHDLDGSLITKWAGFR